MEGGERDLQVIRQLVYQNQFALEDRRFHGAGRHPVPVRDGRLQRGDDDKGESEGTNQLAPDSVGDVFHKRWWLSLDSKTRFQRKFRAARCQALFRWQWD